MSTPVKPEAPAQPPRISPFYRRYLKDQAKAIRARGGDDEAVRQFVQLDLKAPMSAQVADPIDAAYPMATSGAVAGLRGISQALVQGATFGFGDEALGSILGLMTGVDARQGIEEYRAEYAEWARENGGKALAAELVGGFATAGAGAAAGAPGILAMAGRGMAFGALAGAGAGENTELSWEMVGDRMKSALLGSAVGTVVGGGIGVAARYLGPVASALGTRITESRAFENVAKATERFPVLERLATLTPEGQARDLIGQWMRHSGIGADEMLTRAESYWAREQRPTVVELLGDQFVEFARGVLKDRTPAVQAAVKMFEGRQITQGDRLLGNLVVRALDNPKLGLGNIYAAEDALHKQAQREAAPHYASAHAQVVQKTPEIHALLKRPEFRDAWNRAAKIANDELETGRAKGLKVPLITKQTTLATESIPSHTRYVIPDELPVRGIDYMKRELQEPVLRRYAQLGRLDNATRKLRDNELHVLEDRYGQLVGETINQVPDFGKALAAYGGPVRSRDAVTRGYERFTAKDSWYEITKDLRKLSPGDRDFYRLGAVRALRDRMERGNEPLADVARQMFGSKGLRWDDKTGAFSGVLNGDAKRVLALFAGPKSSKFGRSKAARDFFRLLAGEANVSKTSGRALSLPQQISTQKLIEAGTGRVPPVRASPGLNIASVAREDIARSQVALSQAENNALAELFARGLNDPDDLRVLIDALRYDASRRPLKVAKRAMTAVTQTVARGAASVF